jgi:glutaminyl-peptide cyclotransferase
MSDGSDRLTFRDPATFEPQGGVNVTVAGQPVVNLNELECVDGAVWANIWQSEEIVRIDPATGRVTAVVDASGLLTPQERQTVDVLNGIAWVPETKTFLITGKYWPKMFEVAFQPQP